MAEHGKHKWIAGAIKHPGRLHSATGTPEGETIPAAEIERLTHSKDKSLAAAARLGQRLKKMNPWEVYKDDAGWWVVKEGTREKVHKSPHKTREDAMAHVRALYSAEGIGKADQAVKKNIADRGEPKSSPARYRS